MNIDLRRQGSGEGSNRPIAAAIDTLLARHRLHRQAEPRPVADSVLNDNFRVDTDGGPRFVRIHKPSRTRETVLTETRIMTAAAAHGIPVNLPIPDADGEFVTRSGGLLLSLWPWLSGRTLTRGNIDAVSAATLGDMQGRIHVALRDYHDPTLRPGRGGASWDAESSIAVLSRVDDLVRYYAAVPEEHVRIQDAIRFRLSFLERDAGRPLSDFDALPRQATHGDYHERNVMLGDDGAVEAVVDWEGATIFPRVFGLLRAVEFTGVTTDPALDSYLRAYGCHVRLTTEECRLGVEMWWQSTLHDTWIHRMRFIEGDRRVDRFFAEDAERLVRFSDPAYRDVLAARLEASCGP